MAAYLTILGAHDPRLEELVRASGRISTMTWLSDLSTLLDSGAGQPDALLVDVRQDGKLPGNLPALKRQHPSTNVMLLGSAVDPALMLDGMRAGVTEFIAEPLNQRDFDAAITRLLAQRKQVVVGAVFAFVGAKGGVGTTTTAVNVATELARVAPSQTLFADLHAAGGDAALLFGAEPRFSIVDALQNIHRFDEAFFQGLVTATKAGAALLASSDRTAIERPGTQQFRSVVEFAAQLYRYVVLDVPRSDAAVLDALDAASRIVVVTNQELSAVRGASRLAAAMHERYGRDRVLVIVSRFDKQAEISQGDIEKVVASKVHHVLPSDYRLALQALNRGRPLSLDNHNKLAAGFRTLANHLAKVEPEPPKNESSGSLFGRLTGRS